MDIREFLGRVCALDGLPGMERSAADAIAAYMRAYADDVETDTLGNVVARMGKKGGPRVQLSAHMDEIGLIVTKVEDDGFVRFQRFGGVDIRILPGMVVTIYGRQPVTGVIGIKPPHLALPEEADKSYGYKELAIDIGYDGAKAAALVRPGDPVTFTVAPVELNKKRYAMKTMDDRACVASLVKCMERLKGVELECEAVFVASVQEEVGAHGARVSAYALEPDFAIALDVTHGPAPGAEDWRVVPLDKVALGIGPGVHPPLLKRLRDVADAEGVQYQLEPHTSRTGTDADTMRVVRAGVPCALISLPLSYMHTTVETLEIKTLENTARLLAAFLRGVKGVEEGADGLCLSES